MASRRRPLWLVPLLLGLLLFAGCGKRGALVPPEALAPAPVSDLSVAQKGARFELRWTAPSREEGGAPLNDLAGFLLMRRLVLPPGQDCEECPGAYSQLARIDLDYLQGARRIGNLFLADDLALKKGSSYQYKVRSFTGDGAQSRDSNAVRRKAVSAPPPPVVEALSSATGVVLAFVALPPEEGKLVGYNIYRSTSAKASAGKSASAESAETAVDLLPLSPFNQAPAGSTTFEDKDLLLGERYSYRVTSLAEVSGETVESAPSNAVEGALLERD